MRTSMLDLSGPSIDHTAIARGFGVDAVRVCTADELGAAPTPSPART